MATCCEAESDGISEEIELLEAIYVSELEVHGPQERPTLVNLFLHPSTGDDDHDSKYVCVNLFLSIPEDYPLIPPGISIKNPRGLSDAHITSIRDNLIALAKEKIGSPVLYDLIEYTKECLSDNNIPSCPCVICLEHFGKEEKFVKTECYHYFHSACLSNYVDHFLSENKDKTLVCPMCRLEVTYDKSEYTAEENDISSENMFIYKPDAEQLKAQAKRQRVFEHQKRKGGIINIEKEKNKYLIEIKDKKGEDTESNDLECDITPIPVVEETSGTTKLVLTAEGHSDKNVARDQMAKGRNDGNLKEVKHNEGQKRIKVTDTGNVRINADQAKRAAIPGSKDIADCGGIDTGREEKKDQDELSKTGGYRKRKPRSSAENRDESRSQHKEYNKPSNGRKKSDARRFLRNSPSPNDDCGRRPEESKQIKERVTAKNSRPRNHEMQRNERNVNSGKKDGDLEGRFQLDVKAQAKQGEGQDIHLKGQANTVDAEKEGIKNCRSNEAMSSAVLSTPSTEARKPKEYGSNVQNTSDENNPSQVENKQSLRIRKDYQRKSRGARTSRRPQEGNKLLEEKNSQKSHGSGASVTGQTQGTKSRGETAKRNDLPISDKNQSAMKSGKKFPRKSERTFSNVGDNNNCKSEQPKRTPASGFENVRPPDGTDEQKVASRGSGQKGSGLNATGVKSSTRPPPGFENVKPSRKM